MADKVTDPALLAALDGPASPGRVTDPALLAALEPTAPAAPLRRSIGDRLLNKLGEGMAPGFNRVTAATQAATDPILGRTAEWGPDFGGRYSEHLRAIQGESGQTQAEHPLLSGTLQAGGALLSAGALPGAKATGVAALEPVPLATRIGQGARTGGAVGAAYGAGDAPYDAGFASLASHMAGGAAVGGVVGGGLGALVPSHVPNASILRTAADAGADSPAALDAMPLSVQPKPNALRRAIDARVTPTKEAQILEAEGVPLTAGLRNPRSAIGQIETASQSLRYTGPAITAQRDAARKATQGVLLNKVLPPGMEPKKWGEADEALDQIYRGFTKSYDSVKGVDIYPAIHDGGAGVPLQTRGKSLGAFDQILADKGVRATAETRGSVRGFLENQLSLLPNVAKVEKHGMHSKTTYERPSMVAPVPIDRMLAMRSNIRTEIRNTLRGNPSREDIAGAEFLKRAEQAVTDSIESQAPPELAASLKEIDGQYRLYKILEGAVSKAGDGSAGFNGRHVSQTLRQSMSDGQYARGGGGELRDLARAYTRTFDESMSPPTGARLLTVGPLGEWVTGPAVFSMNRPGAPAVSRLPPASQVTLDADPMISALLRAMQLPRAAGATGLAQDDPGSK